MKRSRARRYANAFEAAGFSPIEAENLRLRADLMIELTRIIEARGWTQAETAKRLGVTQPRISDLTRGKLDRFSVDTLIALLSTAGANVTIKVRRGKSAA